MPGSLRKGNLLLTVLSLSVFLQSIVQKDSIKFLRVTFNRVYCNSILSKPKTRPLHEASHLVILVGGSCQASQQMVVFLYAFQAAPAV